MKRKTEHSMQLEHRADGDALRSSHETHPHQQWFRRVVVSALWLASLVWMLRAGAAWLPASLAARLTVESFSVLVQLVAMALGVGLSFAMLSAPRQALGLDLVWGRPLLLAALLAPAIYVGISYAALALALPTLREELSRGGVELVRSQGGAVVTAMTRASVVSPFVWAVVVSPIGEELLFRGALWGAMHALFYRLSGITETRAGMSVLPLERSALLDSLTWLVRSGTLATLGTTVVFAALHADLKGSQGIVRVASAAGLGLACGVARQSSRGVATPIALHVLLNALALASARHWLVTATFPKYYTVPTLIALVGAAGILIASALVVRRRAPGMRDFP